MIDLFGAEHRELANVRRKQFVVAQEPSILDIGDSRAIARPAGHLPDIDRIDTVGRRLDLQGPIGVRVRPVGDVRRQVDLGSLPREDHHGERLDCRHEGGDQ